MKYTVIDVETTQKNKGDDARGRFGASPFHPDNRIVHLGQKCLEDGEYLSCDEALLIGSTLDADVLIGHNIKFDLHYLNKYHDMAQWVRDGGMIWDTMVAEYVLSGQSANGKTPGSLKLGKVLEGYGLEHTLKDTVSEYFEAGMGADEIPEDEILPYLEEDVTLTAELFERQAQEAIERGQMPLLMNMMEATLATWVMEMNGAVIDTKSLRMYGDVVTGHLKMTVEQAQELVQVRTAYHEFNPNSDEQLSTILFGGMLKYTYDEVVNDEEGKPLKYKSGKKKGQIKTKKAVGELPQPRRLDPERYGSVRGKKCYSVTDAVLSSIQEDTSVDPWLHVLCDLVQKVRSYKKEMSTYIDGYLSRVWHDGKLHPEYTTTTTETGRLSCRNPNLQNIKSRG